MCLCEICIAFNYGLAQGHHRQWISVDFVEICKKESSCSKWEGL